MDAFAQTGAAAPANPTVSFALMLLQFLPIILIFYFLIIRPQQQRQKALNLMLKNLKKGDKVLTTAGIYGTVVGFDEQKAVLKIAEDTKVEFSKASIVQVLSSEAQA
jgi:preprotein translocase subunit YajC